MYYKLNEQGFYLGLKQEQPYDDGFQTNVYPIGNFVKGRFDFELNEWVEGATEEEIREYRKLITPEKVSRRQLRQALILSDFDLSVIDNYISNVSNEKERLILDNYWNASTEFERKHPILIEFANNLNFTPEQANDLFILANTL